VPENGLGVVVDGLVGGVPGDEAGFVIGGLIGVPGVVVVGVVEG
jgi:hypothetical protein